MKIKKTEYKILILSRNVFQVCKITSYFGINWNIEYIGGTHQDMASARTLIRMILDSNIEIKYL